MRVESKLPKLLKSGETGWLHKEQCSQPLPPPLAYQPSRPTINCRKLIDQWRAQTHTEKLKQLSQTLCVSLESLNLLEVVWASEHRAWAVPMKGGDGNITGIRLRSDNGDKWAVRGSHQGCFIPNIKPGPMVLVCEGFTDCLAGLTLGFHAVGRPSATGGAPQLKEFVLRHRIRRVAIIADQDEIGIRGARTLVDLLPVPCCIVVLPCKDLRQYVSLGGTRAMLDSKIDQCTWLNVQ